MNKSLLKFLFLGTFACASFAIPAYAAPPAVITSLPCTITVPGKYVLNQNLTSNAFAAILITCGDVTVDLNGYTITGPGGANPKCFGIEAYNANSVIGALSNITLKNGTLTNFRIGILFFPSNGLAGYGATDSTIKNITMSAIDGVAILDNDGKGNHIENCNIIPDVNLTVGVNLVNCTGDLVSGNQFQPLPVYLLAPYQDIIVEGNVEANVVVNNKDVLPHNPIRRRSTL